MWFDYFLYVKNDKMSFKMTVLAYLKTHDSWWAPVRWDIVRWEIVSGFLSYYPLKIMILLLLWNGAHHATFHIPLNSQQRIHF